MTCSHFPPRYSCFPQQPNNKLRAIASRFIPLTPIAPASPYCASLTPPHLSPRNHTSPLIPPRVHLRTECAHTPRMTPLESFHHSFRVIRPLHPAVSPRPLPPPNTPRTPRTTRRAPPNTRHAPPITPAHSPDHSRLLPQIPGALPESRPRTPPTSSPSRATLCARHLAIPSRLHDLPLASRRSPSRVGRPSHRFPRRGDLASASPRRSVTPSSRIESAFDARREETLENPRHTRRKKGLALGLDAHFPRAGRRVYVGSELGALNPARRRSSLTCSPCSTATPTRSPSAGASSARSAESTS